MKMNIAAEFKKIKVKKLKIHADQRGYLFEGLRKDDAIFGGKYGQTLISVVYPGVVKGWHKHKRQTDYTMCIKGNILYGIGDGKKTKTFVMGEKNLILIKVPPGFWHGYMAIDKEAIIVHVMDITYDPDDTEAKDINAFGDVWKIKKRKK